MHKITYGQLWVARGGHIIIRHIDIVRVPQSALESAVLDDWGCNPPLVFGLAGKRYGRGLKSTI